MKTCSKCKIEKSLSEFNKQKRAKDGLHTYCKKCQAEYRKKWHQDNREKNKESSKRWRKENMERASEYYEKYYQENKERKAEYYKKWYKENKGKRDEQHKKWRQSKRESDPLFKLRCNLRSRTCMAFKVSSWKKNTKTQEMLGTDYETAFKHIESRFRQGMSWDNFGEWQIDHIIPLSSAKSKEELVKLCHYTNLQPLWANENKTKGDKIIACRINFN